MIGVRPPTKGVRYNPDTEEFEMRCERCISKKQGGSYWPLTLEFWNPERNMSYCRTCHKELRAMAERERRRTDEEYRRRSVEQVKEIRKVKGHIYNERQRLKNAARKIA